MHFIKYIYIYIYAVTQVQYQQAAKSLQICSCYTLENAHHHFQPQQSMRGADYQNRHSWIHLTCTTKFKISSEQFNNQMQT